MNTLNHLIATLRPKLAALLPDSVYLKLIFPGSVGYDLNLRHPRTLNEKTQWLKLHERKTIFKTMADKIAVRALISKEVGEEYLVPLLGVWNQVSEIQKEHLPSQFVLKTNHDSGGVVLCRDKASFDWLSAERKLNESLSRDYYKFFREWAYKGMPRKILAEQLLVHPQGGDLPDFKIFTFNGHARLSFVATNRHGPGGVRMNFYDRDWNPLPVTRVHPRSETEMPCPAGYNTMIRLAEHFGQFASLLRTDFYQVENRVYIGELTLYPGAGIERFDPPEYDMMFGSWLKLPCDRSDD